MGDICTGTLRNGPDKAFTRCDTCGRVDYERNEGDACGVELNRYQARVEAKRERYADRADKARRESAAAFQSARVIADGIPMGQPILVGHHSEKRHRKDIERIDRGMRKGIEAESKAAYYADKAENHGTHGISSDDPEAVEKLRAVLRELELARDTEKSANAAVRKIAKQRAKDLGRDLTQVDHLEIIATLVVTNVLTPAMGKALASYARAFPWLPQFGNNTSASVRRVEKRIEELEKKAAMPERDLLRGEVDGCSYSIEWNKADNRVQIYFPSRPSDAVVTRLKAHGFRWARSVAAWQRQASESAWYHAQRIVQHDKNGDLDICADCEGSTAPGSPDPHECVSKEIG